jgi:hypothetical protein
MVREKATIITYSPGLSDTEIKALKHIRAESLDWAVTEAIKRLSPTCRVSVLTHAPDMLPIKAF